VKTTAGSTSLNILYDKILKIPYEVLTYDELKDRISHSFLSSKDVDELCNKIILLNPHLYFFKHNVKYTGTKLCRLCWFDSKFKYSTVISKRKINTKNIDIDEISDYIYKTPIIKNLNSKEIVHNLIKEDKYIIYDEEIFISEWFQNHQGIENPIETMINEICTQFNLDQNNCEILHIDGDVCLFKFNDKYVYVDMDEENVMNICHLDDLIELYKHNKSFEFIPRYIERNGYKKI
jgi:hypothetical protein